MAASDRLRELMAARGLTQRQVADLACVSIKTVESWLADPSSANWRRMPDRALVLIRLSLGRKKKGE